jgi:adenylate cyclase
MDRVRIRLRVGIAAMFLLIVVPLAAAMIGFLYERNATLARQMAEQSMTLAAREVTVKVGAMMGAMAHAVDNAVAFGKAQRAELRRPETLRPLLEQLERLDEAYSLYFGMEEDGAFYQVVRMSPQVAQFGPQGKAPPKDAHWALRIIDSASGERRDSYIYLAKWGKTVAVERGEPTYDPRQRPWYQAAIGSTEAIGSQVYVFSSTRQPGLTLSRRLTTEDGARVAVFGIDLSISALSAFLKQQRIGETGYAFILDENGRLVGYPDAAKMIVPDGKSIRVVSGTEVDDPVVAQAARGFAEGRGGRFNVTAADQSTWMVNLSPFPPEFGRKWTVGVVVAEDEFTGPVRKVSLTILAAGILFLLAASLGMVWASRMLVRPIQALISETERISRFELDGQIKVRSRVMEVDSLARSVATMKAGLASFGTYVPKSLVHDIIRSGSGTSVGGQRQPLTVMFSDLQGFTAASESIPPEQLLAWLSSYFDAMSVAIHGNHGVIDKYIGDAVMALWNAPLEDSDHAAHACRGMLACRNAVHRIAEAGGGLQLKTRMGLHTGIAVVGNVGASDRMQYTALGSVVNLASRIEGLNKYLGTELLITGAVAEAIGDGFLLRPLGAMQVSGASVPLDIFELVGEAGDSVPDLDLWHDAMSALRDGRWAEAADRFQAYSSRHAHDKAAGLYLEVLAPLVAGRPGAAWDGILRFTSK